jgi:hypothetical protein
MKKGREGERERGREGERGRGGEGERENENERVGAAACGLFGTAAFQAARRETDRESSRARARASERQRAREREQERCIDKLTAYARLAVLEQNTHRSYSRLGFRLSRVGFRL